MSKTYRFIVELTGESREEMLQWLNNVLAKESGENVESVQMAPEDAQVVHQLALVLANNANPMWYCRVPVLEVR